MALPTTPVTEVPSGNACVFRFMRTGKGFRKYNAGTPYACPAGKTVRVATTLHLDLIAPAAGTGCDETAQLFQGALALDVSQGTSIYRDNKFGLFFGGFSLGPVGSPLFRGRIELYDRVTVQQAPLATSACALKCSPENRLEGWLVAGGTSPATEKLTIRAVVGAQGTVPSLGQAVQLALQNVVMTGVAVRA